MPEKIRGQSACATSPSEQLNYDNDAATGLVLRRVHLEGYWERAMHDTDLAAKEATFFAYQELGSGSMKGN